MPEIGEIARIVHYLRKHLQGRQISRVHYPSEDPKIFQTAKTGLTTASFAAALQGKRVVDVGQQGKYFWLVMDSPPHPLMHFGMTGWIKFRHDETAYYKPMKEKKREEKDATQERLQNGQRGMDAVKSGEKDDTLAQSITSGGEDWPPRFWKFMIETDDKPDAIDAAFIDARRFGRVFAVDAPASAIRNTSPLKENGPDPIVDTQVFTRSWFVARLSTKHVPIKALLLDQSVISGIGNWVADETLYQAAVHPEQYCDTFSDEQAGRLYDSVVEVCSIACETLADSDQFPESWLMRHRVRFVWCSSLYQIIKMLTYSLHSGIKVGAIVIGFQMARKFHILPLVEEQAQSFLAGKKRPLFRHPMPLSNTQTKIGVRIKPESARVQRALESPKEMDLKRRNVERPLQLRENRSLEPKIQVMR